MMGSAPLLGSLYPRSCGPAGEWDPHPLQSTLIDVCLCKHQWHRSVLGSPLPIVRYHTIVSCKGNHIKIPRYWKMFWYPLIKEGPTETLICILGGQQSNAFMLGSLIERGQWSHHIEKCARTPHAIKLLHHIENCARTPNSYTTGPYHMLYDNHNKQLLNFFYEF